MAISYTLTKRKARKSHKCCECRGTIQAGEIYNYHSGIWPDGPGAYKTCLECEALRDEIDSHERDPEFRVPFTMLHEFVFETRDPAVFGRYLDIKRKREAPIQLWMIEREQALAAVGAKS